MSKPDNHIDEWAEIEAMFPVDTDDEQLNFANANKIIGLREARPKIADFYRNKIPEKKIDGQLTPGEFDLLQKELLTELSGALLEKIIFIKYGGYNQAIDDITAQFNSRGKDNE